MIKQVVASWNDTVHYQKGLMRHCDIMGSLDAGEAFSLSPLWRAGVASQAAHQCSKAPSRICAVEEELVKCEWLIWQQHFLGDPPPHLLIGESCVDLEPVEACKGG